MKLSGVLLFLAAAIPIKAAPVNPGNPSDSLNPFGEGSAPGPTDDAGSNIPGDPFTKEDNRRQVERFITLGSQYTALLHSKGVAGYRVPSDVKDLFSTTEERKMAGRFEAALVVELGHLQWSFAERILDNPYKRVLEYRQVAGKTLKAMSNLRDSVKEYERELQATNPEEAAEKAAEKAKLEQYIKVEQELIDDLQRLSGAVLRSWTSYCDEHPGTQGC
ncbi:MAG: hypothetical protein M1829_002112 [Trizodia sp. TS-e1964]|nr:MAG: hypothetical protein M1829_002112 [Trizodia sp. TS-e1964]